MTQPTPEWQTRLRAEARTTAGKKLDVTVGVVDVDGIPITAVAIDDAPPVMLADEDMKQLAASAYVAVHEATLRRRPS